MFYLLIALVVAVLGVIPLMLARRSTLALVAGSIFFLFSWLMFYGMSAAMIYPLGDFFGLFLLIFWLLSCVININASSEGYGDDSGLWTIVFPAGLMVVYLIVGLAGSTIFRADDYAKMIAPIEKRVWTKDVQPKDPKHMCMVSEENALYLAQKVLGSAGAIGSQFEISDCMTRQIINGELWYVVPLDFSGLFVWMTAHKAPGYIMINAEDPNMQPILKILPEEKKFSYMPNACFDKCLYRHLVTDGYFTTGIRDFTFEVDDSGQAWWVATAFQPTIGWSGEKILGAVIIDPVTGDHKFYGLEQVPKWVDRVVPHGIVSDYVYWWGCFSGGWINTWYGSKNLMKPENPTLVYCSDNQPYWVTGITSSSQKDDSLIAVMYTHSRTGKHVLYEVKGGATDAAVLKAVNENQEIRYKSLHGTTPQLYNIYETMASVVPLLNESHAYQGCAIVNVLLPQIVATGRDQHEALKIYQKMLSRAGQGVALEKKGTLETISGEVDRIKFEVCQGSTTIYYVHLRGVPHIFTGGSELSPKLPITECGDMVVIEYYKSGEDVVPIHRFDNSSIVLTSTKSQKDVRERK